eukprot:767253-Hanusia_phi.AAC.6
MARSGVRGVSSACLTGLEASRKRFEEMRRKKDSMLNELEVAGLREIDSVEYYSKQKGNAFLKELRCKNCYVYDGGGHMMAETLRWNRTLTVLDLGRNSIGHSGTIALAHALAHHPSLTSLNLEGNVFGSEAGTALAEMLRSNTSLTACYLADNAIADNGTAAFTRMLQVNTTLQSLDLSGNIVQAECAISFARTIKEYQDKPVLTEFKLLRNDIEIEYQHRITVILGYNWICHKAVKGISGKYRQKLKYEEAVEALTEEQSAMISSAFNAFDTDGSGELEREEFEEALVHVGLEVPREEVDEMIALIDTDGSGTINLSEFQRAMAVMLINKGPDETEETTDLSDELLTDEALVEQMMFSGGLYDPAQVFPEAISWSDGGQRQESPPALRLGYRILCQMEKNISLSDKHLVAVKRILMFLGFDRVMIKTMLPVTARRLREALSKFDMLKEQSGSELSDLETRLRSVETPEDDVSRLDQAILWLFRGIPAWRV